MRAILFRAGRNVERHVGVLARGDPNAAANRVSSGFGLRFHVRRPVAGDCQRDETRKGGALQDDNVIGACITECARRTGGPCEPGAGDILRCRRA